MGKEVGVQTETVSTEVSLVVTRCGCEHPEWHNGSPECLCSQADGENWHSATGEEHVCPSPRQVSDLGVVAYSHTDPTKQAEWDRVGKPLADKRIREANQGVEDGNC